MLGLVSYDSSDEDEVETTTPLESTRSDRLPDTTPPTDQSRGAVPDQNPTPGEHEPEPASTAFHEVPRGPVLGPATGPTPVAQAQSQDDRGETDRSSPFSASRALIQDLTLPPVPNLDIPPSPPGSPDPAANAKFEHFLSLKKQGVHFNSKLANSSSLKNPSLLKKMMEHAGIDEQSQYNTALPANLWSTSSLPPWGFKEEILRAQQELRQQTEDKKASGQRSSIGFVAGSDNKKNANV